MNDWLAFPIVDAPSPGDRTQLVHFQICEEYCSLNAAIYRRTPILQLWAHVAGLLPPINNASRLSSRIIQPRLCTLKDSVACFQGVQRPFDSEANGESILVYVLSVDVSIAFEPDMACVAKAVPMPSETVLTVQVRPTESLQIGTINVTGTVTRIEVVVADDGEPTLPKGYAERYGKRLWV